MFSKPAFLESIGGLLVGSAEMLSLTAIALLAVIK